MWRRALKSFALAVVDDPRAAILDRRQAGCGETARPAVRTCVVCGMSFVPARSHQQVRSNVYRQRRNRERGAEKGGDF
jgi:hypothetical protein